jgi:hypothetical protein
MVRGKGKNEGNNEWGEEKTLKGRRKGTRVPGEGEGNMLSEPD